MYYESNIDFEQLHKEYIYLRIIIIIQFLNLLILAYLIFFNNPFPIYYTISYLFLISAIVSSRITDVYGQFQTLIHSSLFGLQFFLSPYGPQFPHPTWTSYAFFVIALLFVTGTLISNIKLILNSSYNKPSCEQKIKNGVQKYIFFKIVLVTLGFVNAYLVIASVNEINFLAKFLGLCAFFLALSPLFIRDNDLKEFFCSQNRKSSIHFLLLAEVVFMIFTILAISFGWI